MSKTVRLFWNVLSGCLLVLVLSLGITKAVTGWSGVGPYRVFFIMSGSMEPEIHKHQLVLAKRLSVRETLVPGDIYAYKKRAWFGEKIVIHRLDEVLPDGTCRFLGDANLLPDAETVARENIGYRMVWY